MNREEARMELIRTKRAIFMYDLPSEAFEAIDMAIEALSAEYEDYEHASLVDIKKPLKVLVVRCKDCKHWQKTNIETIDGEPTYDCPFCGEWADANGFCSFGERREE